MGSGTVSQEEYPELPKRLPDVERSRKRAPYKEGAGAGVKNQVMTCAAVDEQAAHIPLHGTK